MTPVVFISYSHDSESHKDWIAVFSKQLLKHGVNVILDRWDLCAGQHIPRFMADSIQQANKVLVICSPNYVNKTEKKKGGAGYEGMIIDSELAENLDTTKFIPIIRHGETNLVPKFLQGRSYIDFREDSKFEDSLSELIYSIFGVPILEKPVIGQSPFSKAVKVSAPYSRRSLAGDNSTEWQDDENLFRDARDYLEKREIFSFSSRQDIRRSLWLHEFSADDERIQASRLRYCDQVLNILSGTVGRREALEISLAGADQHNRSIMFKNGAIDNLELHIREIRQLYGFLSEKVILVQIKSPELGRQIDKWLNIHRKNMESTIRHMISMKKKHNKQE